MSSFTLKRKGIILAGGRGSRLYPCTNVLSKQLLPIYDKPMIFYPLSTLMCANIREILIISTNQDIPRFEKLLKDGSQWGINISYEIQDEPNGIAEAFIIGKNFLKGHPSVLILGDNIFYGTDLDVMLQKKSKSKVSTIFAYKVKNPDRYGVVYFDKNNIVKSIVEKPIKPLSNYAVTGLYFFDENAVEIAENLKPSHRNELEITDLNNAYLKEKKLKVEILGKNSTWIDTGTFDSLLYASNFVQDIQKNKHLMIACIEEIALRKKWIDITKLKKIIQNYGKNEYSDYLVNIYKNENI